MPVLLDNYLMMKKRTGAIIVFYNDEGKILLQERGDYSKIGEEWAFFGGGVEDGETPLEGFLREAREELGLDMAELDYTYIGEQIQYYPERDFQATRHFYLIKTKKKETDFTVLEGVGCKYFTLEEARKLKFPNSPDKMMDLIEKYICNTDFPIFRKISHMDDQEITKFMEIRKKSLLEDIGKYNLMSYPEEEENFSIEGYKQREHLKNYYCLDINSKMIGYIAIHQSWKNRKQGQHIFGIGPVYIDTDYMKKGYGKFMLQSLLDFVVNSFHFPLTKFILSVNKDSVAPYSLYKTVGFEDVGVNKSFICTKEGNYLDVIDMTKIVYL